MRFVENVWGFLFLINEKGAEMAFANTLLPVDI
jgi:hypothetical protein